MGTKRDPGARDCYASAGADEPLFVLLARDRHAPTLVWLWSVLREIDGEAPEVVRGAQQVVLDMISWAHAHGRKSVGLAHAALAGALELIRDANHRSKQALAEIEPFNEPLAVAQARAFLAQTEWEEARPRTGAENMSLPEIKQSQILKIIAGVARNWGSPEECRKVGEILDAVKDHQDYLRRVADLGPWAARNLVVAASLGLAIAVTVAEMTEDAGGAPGAPPL